MKHEAWWEQLTPAQQRFITKHYPAEWVTRAVALSAYLRPGKWSEVAGWPDKGVSNDPIE